MYLNQVPGRSCVCHESKPCAAQPQVCLKPILLFCASIFFLPFSVFRLLILISLYSRTTQHHNTTEHHNTPQHHVITSRLAGVSVAALTRGHTPGIYHSQQHQHLHHCHNNNNNNNHHHCHHNLPNRSLTLPGSQSTAVDRKAVRFAYTNFKCNRYACLLCTLSEYGLRGA